MFAPKRPSQASKIEHRTEKFRGIELQKSTPTRSVTKIRLGSHVNVQTVHRTVKVASYSILNNLSPPTSYTRDA